MERRGSFTHISSHMVTGLAAWPWAQRRGTRKAPCIPPTPHPKWPLLTVPGSSRSFCVNTVLHAYPYDEVGMGTYKADCSEAGASPPATTHILPNSDLGACAQLLTCTPGATTPSLKRAQEAQGSDRLTHSLLPAGIQ